MRPAAACSDSQWPRRATRRLPRRKNLRHQADRIPVTGRRCGGPTVSRPVATSFNPCRDTDKLKTCRHGGQRAIRATRIPLLALRAWMGSGYRAGSDGERVPSTSRSHTSPTREREAINTAGLHGDDAMQALQPHRRLPAAHCFGGMPLPSLRHDSCEWSVASTSKLTVRTMPSA